MTRICSLLFCYTLMFAWQASAQSINLRRAGDAMQELDYMTAILLYQQTLQNEDVAEAKINLAECYRKINDTENAEYWYEKVVRLPNPKPIYKLYYAMMLQANGKNIAAKPWLQQYLQENPDDARGQFLLKSCEVEASLKTRNRDIYVVNPLPFNSNLDDFSPSLIDDQIIFASDRDRGTIIKRTSMWTGNPFSDLYALQYKRAGAQPGDFNYTEPTKFSKEINTKYNEAAVAIAPDHQTIYFTRNNYLDGKTGHSEEGLVKLKIFAAKKDPATGEWNQIENMPFNSDEFHTAFPSLSADGNRLFFASNKPGGYGGMDLYVSNRENGNWGQAINLGPIINTEGNEIFPFMASDNRLYFASNGHIGLGGQDIYYSSTTGGQDAWNLPINLGAPVNSNHDDFAITFGRDLSWGFFTSDRDGGVGRDDIYGFQKHATPVEVYAYDASTKNPLQGVVISSSKSGLSITTGKDGKVTFDMRNADCDDFSVTKKGFESSTQQICTNDSTLGNVPRIEIAVQKQYNFTVQGIVFDMTDGLPADAASVMLLNDCGKAIPEAVLTNDNGRFKFKLDKACTYRLRAVHDGYIAAESAPFTTKDLRANHIFRVNINLEPYQDGKIIASTDGSPRFNPASGLYEHPDGTPANYVMGEGMEVKNGILYDDGSPSLPAKNTWARSGSGFLINLYYDFDQVAVSEASKQELSRLLNMLLTNPEMNIEIAAHTDARGSDAYNLQLSQSRADAVVAWLEEKGVPKKRLVAHGYGETQLVNQCGNEVNCTEQEHQLNRRTEFRILGKNGELISKPQKGVKVVPCAGCPF
ncbi:MAG: OmpA family protein [Saprospiraceae bacterium]|nr:OmpA family protein [Saprospiraceae bacterium]